MTIAELVAIREEVGNLTLQELAACGDCTTLYPQDELVNVSDYAPMVRGGVACEDCAHRLAEAAHVGLDACSCSECGRRRQLAVWGRRVVRGAL